MDNNTNTQVEEYKVSFITILKDFWTTSKVKEDELNRRIEAIKREEDTKHIEELVKVTTATIKSGKNKNVKAKVQNRDGEARKQNIKDGFSKIDEVEESKDDDLIL